MAIGRIITMQLTTRLEKAAKAFVATMKGYGFTLIDITSDGFCMEQLSYSPNALSISSTFRRSTKTSNGFRDHMSISFYTYGPGRIEKETNRVISIYDKVPAREVAMSIGCLSMYEAGVSEENQKR